MYTIKLQRHFPISFVYYIIYANGEIKQNLFEYFGLDAPKKLYEKLKEDALFIAKNYLDKKIKMKKLSETQNMEYKNAKRCHICERKFTDHPPSIEKEIRILNKKISITRDIISKLESTSLKQDDKISKIVNEKKIEYEEKGNDGEVFYYNFLLKLNDMKSENTKQERLFKEVREYVEQLIKI